MRESGAEPLARTLTQALRGSDMLLLADNCEHVAAASADLIAALVAGCPRVTVLATSREPLRIRAERRFGVPPLRVPDLARLPAPAALARVPSVRLFLTCWAAANPGFRLTAAQARAVGEICVRLDGLPLALELAAAHGRPLSAADLLARLDALPELPGAGHRDLPRRHRSLRAVLDWSYDLLDPAAQAVFIRLGVFAGGFDAAVAAEVVGAEVVAAGVAAPDGLPGGGVDRAIDALIEANLVLCYQTPGGSERLRLLEPVRGYARERLVAAGGLDGRGPAARDVAGQVDRGQRREVRERAAAELARRAGGRDREPAGGAGLEPVAGRRRRPRPAAGRRDAAVLGHARAAQ